MMSNCAKLTGEDLSRYLNTKISATAGGPREALSVEILATEAQLYE